MHDNVLLFGDEAVGKTSILRILDTFIKGYISDAPEDLKDLNVRYVRRRDACKFRFDRLCGFVLA